MRYWVYQGTRILGPFHREGLSSVAGLTSDSLVCQADASGNDHDIIAFRLPKRVVR